MYWNFYIMPYQQPTPFTISNIIIQGPPIDSNIENQEKSQEKITQPNCTGIQINLTPAQLLQAGYETNKKPWTEEEDSRLMAIIKNSDLSWKEVAQQMPGRTSKMCYSRYRRIQSQNKKIWDQDEDIKIKEAVGKWGLDWEKISTLFSKRTPKQIQDHYNNYLRPGINKEPWTYEEDLELMQLLRKFGKNWSLIETKIPGRTHNQIKNRYYGRIKRIEDKKAQAESIKTLQRN